MDVEKNVTALITDKRTYNPIGFMTTRDAALLQQELRYIGRLLVQLIETFQPTNPIKIEPPAMGHNHCLVCGRRFIVGQREGEIVIEEITTMDDAIRIHTFDHSCQQFLTKTVDPNPKTD